MERWALTIRRPPHSEGEREEFLGGVDSSLFCEIEVEWSGAGEAEGCARQAGREGGTVGGWTGRNAA